MGIWRRLQTFSHIHATLTEIYEGKTYTHSHKLLYSIENTNTNHCREVSLSCVTR